MIIAAAAYAGYQLISGYQQAETIRENAKLRDQIDGMNEWAAEQDAFNAEKEGYSHSARYQSTIDSTVADQRTAYASKNVDVNFGTAADVQADSKVTGFLNQLDIQRQASEKAYGYKREELNTRLQSGMNDAFAEEQAGAKEAEGTANAAKTFMSGYGGYQKAGGA